MFSIRMPAITTRIYPTTMWPTSFFTGENPMMSSFTPMKNNSTMAAMTNLKSLYAAPMAMYSSR